MKLTAANTIDVCQACLLAAGWSIGDMAFHADGAVNWMVFAHKGNERVVAKARRQARAWRDAVRLAVGANGAQNGRA